MEQKREIAVMKSYMASEESAAQESAIIRYTVKLHNKYQFISNRSEASNHLHLSRSSMRRRWSKV